MQEKIALQKAMQQKNMIVLYRDTLEAAEYAGIPVAVEDELTVLHKENNYALDGYAAVRTGDITMVEQMDDVPFCRRVLEGEKVYEAVAAPGFGCRNWQSLLGGILKTQAGWVTVECEGTEESLYYVGRIQTVDERYLTMRRVDADGTWHTDPVTLPLDDITLVSFGDRYLNLFRKYCKG